MDGQTCSSCSAQNTVEATHCWQCYQRFSAPGPIPSIIRGLNQPRYGSGYTPPVSAPTKPLATARTALLTRGALISVLLLGLVWMWSGAGGFSFPNYVGGVKRIETDLINSGGDMVPDAISATGADVDIYYAFYGPDLQPTYVMFAAESREEDLRWLLREQGRRNRTGVGCAPDHINSYCMWRADDGVVGLYGWGLGVGVMSPLSESVRSNMD